MLHSHSSKLVDAVKFFSTFEQRNAFLRNVVSYANHGLVCLSFLKIVASLNSNVMDAIFEWKAQKKKKMHILLTKKYVQQNIDQYIHFSPMFSSSDKIIHKILRETWKERFY